MYRLSLNFNHIQNYCTFEILANFSNKFLGRVKYKETKKELDFHANILDLLYSVVYNNLTTIPALPTVVIHNNPILNIFNNNQSAQALLHIV